MFDISWGELILIGVVALVVIGPKELPTVLRTVGQWMTKVRRMASEFQGQFQEAMREAEFADLKKQVDSIGDVTRDMTTFNPIEKAKQDFEAALDNKPRPAEAAVDPAAAPDAGLAGPASSPVATSPLPPAADAPPAPPPTGLEPTGLQPAPKPPETAQPAAAQPAEERDFNPDQPAQPSPQTGGGRAA